MRKKSTFTNIFFTSQIIHHHKDSQEERWFLELENKVVISVLEKRPLSSFARDFHSPTRVGLDINRRGRGLVVIIIMIVVVSSISSTIITATSRDDGESTCMHLRQSERLQRRR
jgi:hypothetical protein